MEFKGTKGKWNIKNISYNKKWINISSEKGIIARTFYGEEEPIVTDEESEANALLISKAPEMLEMLIYLVYNEEIHYEEKDKVLNLIKEATEI
jgi:hypothetical protein